MATNYVQRGRVIDVVAGASGMTSGAPLAIGSVVGVPQIDGISGDLVPCGVKGVYQLPLKAGGSDPAIGEPCHFNAATGDVSVGADLAVSGDINGFGYIAENGCVAADTVVAVNLMNPGALI